MIDKRLFSTEITKILSLLAMLIDEIMADKSISITAPEGIGP